MSYIVLRGHWRDIIVLNIHATTEDTIDDVKDKFYHKLGHAFDKFHKHYINSSMPKWAGKTFSN
jgi:hypothetical protein